MSVNTGLTRAPDSRALGTRIDAMFSRDRIWALGFVVALWLVLGLILFQVNGVLEDDSVRIACLVAGLAVALFNTASMLALIRHYSEDKQYIYELDIRHLDEGRAQRS